jgi:hydrogenase expression/formation protein HypD
MKLEQVIKALKEYDGEPVKIMEVCGTHTKSIFQSGIRTIISPKIQLISGPGCPVCVTSPAYIDHLTDLSLKEKYCVLTFGDMMKVKGSKLSLTEAKALGAKVKVLYSPLAAIAEAERNSDTQYVFAAVGFETTTPIYALLLDEIRDRKIKNLKLATSIKTILPALSFICENETSIDAFLSPGHVSVITGSKIYKGLANTYQKPFVVAGFEGEHILAAIYEIMSQLKGKRHEVRNLYSNAVTEEGNQKAESLINQYFEEADGIWRGIGKIAQSALKLKEEYKEYDAGSREEEIIEELPMGCRCADVILGRIQPVECPLFQRVCTPLHAVGPCMVSAEGACGIWYQNS